MKLIIDIPEDEYNIICNNNFYVDSYFRRNLSNTFKNATPVKETFIEPNIYLKGNEKGFWCFTKRTIEEEN